MKLRFNVWKDWYKRCLNGRAYKIMVLFGLRHSPTFERNLRMASCGKIIILLYKELRKRNDSYRYSIQSKM